MKAGLICWTWHMEVDVKMEANHNAPRMTVKQSNQELG